MIELQRLRDLLERLTQLPGVSGMEQPVVRALYEALRPFADKVEIDAFGNVIASRHGDENGPRLMIAAHSDEVGAVVTNIDPKGFLRFRTVGAINSSVLPGTRVRVAERYIGVIGSIPGHITSSATTQEVLPPSALHIDIGAGSDEEARAWGVCEGTGVVFESPLVDMEGSHLVMGKAIDNRIGCAVLIAAFEALAGVSLPVQLHGVINVQEEIGMRGAHMTTAQVEPDYAIVLDTVPAEDTPMAAGHGANFRIGAGPVVQLWEGRADLFLGTVAHPGVRDLILKTAEDEGISVQLSAAYGLWLTDGAAIHVAGKGVPTGFISIPRRYAHTPNEILDIRDAQRAATLIEAIACRSGSGFRAVFLE